MKKRSPVLNAKKRKPAKSPLRADPTRTATLRRALSNELRKRFQRLKFEITKLIVDEDALGLKPLPGAFSLNNRWRYQSDPKKLAAFNAWLRDQVSRGLSGKGIEDLLKRYAKAGFEKGGARAFDDTKRSVRSKAAGQRQLDFYEGTRDQFMRSSFGRPVAIEKIEMLASRSYTDLQGVNEAMATKIARSLTDGLVQGKGPREIARDMADDVDGIGIARATTIAQTELMRSHAEGTLDSLEQLGVEEIGVMVEWTVTDDEKLCPLCDDLEGVILTIQEARGMFPRHPRCRCQPIPANVGEPDSGQKRTKSSIDAAIRRSKSKDDDDWGPEVEISVDRPVSVLNTDISQEMLEFSRWMSGSRR